MALQLTVVTPEGQAFDAEVEQVVLPGSEGDFGVLAEHERFLTALKPGAVEIKSASGSQWAAVSDGFADVSSESVTVLVSRCELSSDLDAATLSKEVDELESALASADEEARDEIEFQLASARVRLDVAGR
ncbi:MAG: ATP synthase F1 subunit epsilon [Myxococcota bacterium]|nr:ATP synthase F1 subunit epsilon [Myxococcota bacterium]